MSRRIASFVIIVVAAVLLVQSSAPAERIPFPAGRFDKPAGRHGERFAPAGFRGDATVRRYRLAGAHRRAITVAAGRLRATLAIPPIPPRPGKRRAKKPFVPPAGWFGVVSVDVFGVDGAESATLRLTVVDPDDTNRRATRTQAVVARAPGRDRKSTNGPTRLHVRVPAAMFADVNGRLAIEIDVRGAAVVVDDLRVERFHRAPTARLRGKSNGHLGPDRMACGALGFDALTEHLNTAFSVYRVDRAGPAYAAGLRRGDVAVAIGGRPLAPSSLAPGWRWFRHSHEATLGRAIEAAVAGDGHVTLTVLRPAGPRDLRIPVPHERGFAPTFPYDDPAATQLRGDVIDWIVTHQRKNGSWPGTNAVNPALGALALLGTRDVRHRERIERTIEFLRAKHPRPSRMKGLAYWALAFQGILFAEYHLATGDRRALRWMQEAVDWLPTTTHTAKWGMRALGHGPKGLPYGKKSLMAPTAHLLVFDALARRCRIDGRLWSGLEPYILHSWSDPRRGGHGGMGYNGSYKDKGEFWSRTGLTALALRLDDRHPRMRRALTGIMKRRHPWMLNSHAYGEPGGALGLLSLAVADPAAFRAVMPQWRWRFLSLWQPGFGLRYSTPHMGSPYMGEEAINNLAYGVLFAVLNRGLVIAGGDAKRWLARP